MDPFDIKEIRAYPGFRTEIVQHAAQWLKAHGYKVKTKGSYLKSSKKGVHVNFKPCLNLFVQRSSDGWLVLTLHHYAKLKIVTGVVGAVLTSGLTTVVGAGTYANHVLESKGFVHSMWAVIDGQATGSPRIIQDQSQSQQQHAGAVPPPAFSSAPSPNVSMMAYSQQPTTGPTQHYAQPQQLPPSSQLFAGLSMAGSALWAGTKQVASAAYEGAKDLYQQYKNQEQLHQQQAAQVQAAMPTAQYGQYVQQQQQQQYPAQQTYATAPQQPQLQQQQTYPSYQPLQELIPPLGATSASFYASVPGVNMNVSTSVPTSAPYYPASASIATTTTTSTATAMTTSMPPPPVVAQTGTCVKCEGKGALGAFGPCKEGDIHFKRLCPTCNGNKTTNLLIMCPRCKGKCGWGPFGPCDVLEVHLQSMCAACDGKGFTARPLTACTACNGKGGHGAFGPCELTDVHFKTICTNCNGRCYF
eukprot:GEZU01038821.1.p1 GENE.GEZU01038821.1~~GEZU01038821.1.p1  ORF type:complete len:471 (-),score=87.28 GEZU01038821.1:349-1761(-)